MQKRLLAILLVFLGGLLWVTNSWAISESGVLFLLIEPGARPSGAGEAFVAIADDATATYYNPAGLAFQKGRELILMHTNWLPAFANDLYYEFLGYTQYVEGWGNLGFNVSFLSLGKQVRTSESGEMLGEFQSYDAAASFSYGTKLSSKLAAGVTMKLIYSHLADIGAGEEKGEGRGVSFAIDLGILYKDLLPRLSIGAALQNMGPAISYIDAEQADPLPQNLRVGFAYRLVDNEYNRLLVTADVNKFLVRRDPDGSTDPFYKALVTAWYDRPLREEIEGMIENIGIEYWYGSWVALRAGYSNDKAGELQTPTFGVGLKYSMFQFDIAYLPFLETPLQDNTRFSLSVKF